MYFVLRTLMRPDLWKPYRLTPEEAMKTANSAYRSAVGVALAAASSSSGWSLPLASSWLRTTPPT